MKKNIVFHNSWGELINNLPVEAAGQLIQMICKYSFEGETEPSGNELIDAMFSMIKSKLNEDAEAYDEAIKKRSEAGKKGMQKRWIDNKDITKDNNVITNDNTVKHNITNITDTVTVTDTDTDKDKKKNTKKKFTPPTLDEVKAYCAERNSPVDPIQFFEYFNAGNWIDSKGQKVTSWKQKLITWESYNNKASPKEEKGKFDDIAARLINESMYGGVG